MATEKKPKLDAVSDLVAVSGVPGVFTFANGETRPLKFSVRKVALVERVFEGQRNFVEALETKPTDTTLTVLALLFGAQFGGDIKNDDQLDALMGDDVSVHREIHTAIVDAWWESTATPDQREALRTGRPNVAA